MKKIKIFLADDHQIFREGLKMILRANSDYEVVGESGSGKDALEKIDQLKPDLAILDISMPDMTGIEVAKDAIKFYSKIKVIILSRHDNIQYINEVLKNGINGYVLKDEAADDLVKAVEVVLQGETYLSPRVTKHLITDHFTVPTGGKIHDSNDAFASLTDRERQILKLISEAKTNKEIASKLWISPKTVKAHRNNIMKKLNIHNVVDLVRFAVKNGLIDS
jgi:DNA-binding NarL/FixJ family response regulator